MSFGYLYVIFAYGLGIILALAESPRPFRPDVSSITCPAECSGCPPICMAGVRRKALRYDKVFPGLFSTVEEIDNVDRKTLGKVVKKRYHVKKTLYDESRIDTDGGKRPGRKGKGKIKPDELFANLTLTTRKPKRKRKRPRRFDEEIFAAAALDGDACCCPA